MRILVLGFIFDLDLSAASFGEDIEIKPHHYKPKSKERKIMRHNYGEVQTGLISFGQDGARLQDWFENFDGKVGEAPKDFDANGANGGNPMISCKQDGDTACIELEDGLTATIQYENNSAWIVEASHEYTHDESIYILTTSQQMRAA